MSFKGESHLEFEKSMEAEHCSIGMSQESLASRREKLGMQMSGLLQLAATTLLPIWAAPEGCKRSTSCYIWRWSIKQG
jgi:hypothetical protein